MRGTAPQELRRQVATLCAPSVPVLDFVVPLAAAKGRARRQPAARRNLADVDPYCTREAGITESERLVLADAQTSGGLLMAVPPNNVETLVAELQTPSRPGRVDRR